LNWRKVKIAVGSLSSDKLGRDTSGNKNERDNSEVERRRGDESKRRPEEERSMETRETCNGGTRSILREESEEVMDGTSVMVQPSISLPIPLLFIIPAVADTPPRALSFFPSCASAGPKASDEATLQV
jgi:hypothetical protein